MQNSCINILQKNFFLYSTEEENHGFQWHEGV